MIQLVGPGGAGKTAAGTALAALLGVRFVDLDAEFAARHGDISAYLGARGYDAYAQRNVSLWSALVGGMESRAVVALSSGFMTYRENIHPSYVQWRQQLASSESTFVLLPSLDLETCVAEIVRRQLRRSFARTSEREEQVIRARFCVYVGLPARKVETMRPIDAVVAELLRWLRMEPPAARVLKAALHEGMSGDASGAGRLGVRRPHELRRTAGVYSSLYDRPPVIRLQTTYDSTETTITPTVAPTASKITKTPAISLPQSSDSRHTLEFGSLR